MGVGGGGGSVGWATAYGVVQGARTISDATPASALTRRRRLTGETLANFGKLHGYLWRGNQDFTVAYR